MPGSEPDPRATDPAVVALLGTLRQPDQLSCGATVLVAATMLVDPGYAELVRTGHHPRTGHRLSGDLPERFRTEVLALHRRLTGPVDLTGHLQLPWPRSLGTPPWAVARQLSGLGGVTRTPVHHRTRLVTDRAEAFDRLRSAVSRGPGVLYVGNRWLPRHVVLVIDGGPTSLRCYEPGSRRVVSVAREEFLADRLDLGAWGRAWLTVLAEPAG